MPKSSQTNRRMIAQRLRFNVANAREFVVSGNYDAFKREFAAAFDAVEPERFDAKTGQVVGGGGPDYHTRMEAVKLYAQVAGFVGTQSTFLLQLNASLGVKNEEELRQFVEAGRKFLDSEQDASLTAEQYGQIALDMLIRVAPKAPALIDSAIERLTAIRGSTTAQDAPSANGDG